MKYLAVLFLGMGLLLAACGGANGNSGNTNATSGATPVATAVVTTGLANGATGTPSGPPTSTATVVTTSSGLQFQDLVVGTGASPQPGQIAVVNYTGWLQSTGHKFDSSKDRGLPFEFPVGQGQVIKGWDEGIVTMKVGGMRKLIIPPSLGYGEQGASGVIPPNETLIFVVELLGIK